MSPLDPAAEKWCTCKDCGQRHRTPEAQKTFATRADTCVDCKERCGDFYEVRDQVWTVAGMERYGGVLHLECLEARLKRFLTPADFTQAPINNALRYGYRMGKAVKTHTNVRRRPPRYL